MKEFLLKCGPNLRRDSVNGNAGANIFVEMLIIRLDVRFEGVLREARILQQLASGFYTCAEFFRFLRIFQIQFPDSGLICLVCSRLLQPMLLLQLRMKQRIVDLPRNFKSLGKTVFLPFFQFQRERQTACACGTLSAHRNPSFPIS